MQIEGVLAGLDRQRSYFSVVHFAGLLAKEQIVIPCDLKLTLFVGGGPEDSLWAPHVTYVPIPLLLKVRPGCQCAILASWRPGLTCTGLCCLCSCPAACGWHPWCWSAWL